MLAGKRVPEDVRNPRIALQYAAKALAQAGSPTRYLHALGWAQYLLTDHSSAVATLARALSLLPASGPAVGLPKQIETDLARFKTSSR